MVHNKYYNPPIQKQTAQVLGMGRQHHVYVFWPGKHPYNTDYTIANGWLVGWPVGENDTSVALLIICQLLRVAFPGRDHKKQVWLCASNNPEFLELRGMECHHS